MAVGPRARAAIAAVIGLILLVAGATAAWGPVALVMAGAVIAAFGLAALVFGGDS